jgi:hypothetical protein
LSDAFTSPPEGIVDAIAELLAVGRSQAERTADAGLLERKGTPLNDQNPRCVAALNLQMIVVGTVVGTLLAVLLLLAIYVMRSHREATKRILVSFMKHEGVLGVKLAWEFWVREP